MPPDARWLQPEGFPAGVGALMTTRAGGCSVPPWNSLNLGVAVGDDPQAVADNRARLQAATGAVPVFMKQVHGTRVVRLTAADIGSTPEADACVCDDPRVACTVQVADCMPVLFAAPGAVGAAHAGWRGLAGGVLEATVVSLCELAACEPGDVSCWLGPCIGPRTFEVGVDVLEGFHASPASADALRFQPLRPGKWLANLPQLARDRLAAAGLRQIKGGEWCTVEDASRFFSFRRDGVTGRMAAAIWLR
jgi:YfiH family protein